MKTRAAVAFQAKKPLEIVELDLDGPKAGEVLVEIKATGICHTDAYTLDGFDSEGIFPSILGHEGAGIVREVGPGVASVKPGDHVIPLYTPECRQCKSCLSGKTNLCTAIRATQGKGLMPDGTSRFSHKGQTIFHYMGCSTFSNFTVLPEIAVAKIREDAPFDKSCYIGCGVTTGVGAVVNTAKVTPGANVVVFGLGGIGLYVVPLGVGPGISDRGFGRLGFLFWRSLLVRRLGLRRHRDFGRGLVENPVGDQFQTVVDEEPRQGVAPDEQRPAPAERRHERDPIDGDQGRDDLGAEHCDPQDPRRSYRPEGTSGAR